MRRTSPADVLVPLVLGFAVGYPLVRLAYSSLPRMSWIMVAPLALLAVAEFWISRRVRAAVRHRPGVKPVTALSIARSVALAKASVLVGAAMTGAMLGFVAYVFPRADTATKVRHDLWVAVAYAACAAAVAVAGLVLERAAIDPSQQ